MANKAYKFRIYPDAEQKVLFAKTFGCTRLVYNYYLDKKIKLYQKDKSRFSYTQCAGDMAKLKKEDDYLFLSEVDSIALQQSLRHLDTAFQNFFIRPKTGFPKFKSRRNKKSYTTICINNNIALQDGFLKLPKIGLVKVKQHRSIPRNYVLKSVTVSQSASGNYYTSVLTQ
ncbi:MAG: helix-turn-helix domain-containing protein [Ruminococcus sp.]|nr:helix-turn-helix domain-containing protein [Ruminococcus sp.]